MIAALLLLTQLASAQQVSFDELPPDELDLVEARSAAPDVRVRGMRVARNGMAVGLAGCGVLTTVGVLSSRSSSLVVSSGAVFVGRTSGAVCLLAPVFAASGASVAASRVGTVPVFGIASVAATGTGIGLMVHGIAAYDDAALTASLAGFAGAYALAGAQMAVVQARSKRASRPHSPLVWVDPENHGVALVGVI